MRRAEEVRVGGYQVLALLLLSINFITVAMNNALALFYRHTPKFYCQESDMANVSNRTYGCLAAGTSCPGGYVFEAVALGRPYHERSVATEFQLVCERGHLLRSLTEIYFAGLLLGGLVTGFLADRIGRLPVLAICLYAQGVMSIVLNLVETFEQILIFRGLQGFFLQGLESSTFVLCMELFPAKHRTLVALVMLSIRSLGLVIMSGLSFAIPDWRILQLIACVPTAVTVLYIWLIPESPRWLLAKGKTVEADLLLERFAKYNSLLGLSDSTEPRGNGKTSRSLPDNAKFADIEKSLVESKSLLTTVGLQGTKEEPAKPESEETRVAVKTSDEKSGGKDRPAYQLVAGQTLDENGTAGAGYALAQPGVVGFLKSRFIGRTCLLLMFAWFASSTAFHGLVTLPQRLSTERHVSLTLAAGIEIGTFLLSYLLASSRWTGRRWALSIGQILGGAACLVIAVIALNYSPTLPPTMLPHWLGRTRMALVTLGRVSNIASFFILRLVMSELLPTVSRATGVGLCIGAEMIGGLLMPAILLLNRLVPELGRLVIGLSCICSGLLVLRLPETQRTVLPDTADEAKRLTRKNDE